MKKSQKQNITQKLSKEEPFSLRNTLKDNSFWLGILALLTFLVYLNVLNGEFTVVDDYYGFVENQNIRDLIPNLKSFQLPTIIYSLSYNLFGLNSFPLHFFALLFHTVNVILIFLIFYLLFGKKTAIIASSIFAVHPVNTEAVSWISGTPYLYNGFFIYLALFFYFYYRKNKNRRYLIISIAIYLSSLIFIRNPWVITTSAAILIIDQFFLAKSFSKKNLAQIMIFISISFLFYVLYIRQAQVQRAKLRQNTPEIVHQKFNQESLKPIVEGYPYTLYTMSRLYVYPKNLTIYHDGNPVARSDYYAMYFFAVFYLILFIYLLKKERIAAGFLLILPVFLAPAFSPLKITWYMAERYLYAGSAFFAGFVSYLFLKMEKRTHIRNLSFYLAAIVILLFAIRTVRRNFNWQNSKNLALATIETSPQNIRAYNDLAGYYVLNGRFEEAIYYYKEALKILPSSNTAIRNLGNIYINLGPLTATGGGSAKMDPELADALFEEGRLHHKSGDIIPAVYFLVYSLETNPNLVPARNLLGNIYLKGSKFDFAFEQFIKSLEIDVNQEEILFRLGYLEYKRNNLEKSKEYLKRALALNPENADVLKNLALVEEALEKTSNP